MDPYHKCLPYLYFVCKNMGMLTVNTAHCDCLRSGQINNFDRINVYIGFSVSSVDVF